MAQLFSLTPVAIVISLVSPIQDHPHDRARRGMGFDQQRTTHHFLIETNGGTIQVTAKDPQDRESEGQIRAHLQHIAHAFGTGDFSLPFFIHDTEPPGTAVMKEKRSALTFQFEPIRAGAKVVVRTPDPQALAALHDFLRFQIREHKTGDPLMPPESGKESKK
jgi:hypothetical protein